MVEQIEPLRFSGRHRTGCGWRVDDDTDRLRVGPVPVDPRAMNWVGVWMLFILSVGLVLSLVMGSAFSGPTDRLARAFPLLVIVLGLPCTILVVGLLHSAFQSEFEKGPVFEYDRARRVVILPRNKLEARVEDVLAVGLLSGPFRFSDELHRASELSLIVTRPGQPPLVLTFLMDSGLSGLDDLAGRVAAALGCPLRRERLDAS